MSGFLTKLQYQILKRIAPEVTPDPVASPGVDQSRIALLLGEELLTRVRGKVVIDFGCGEGQDSIRLAACGASKVIGLDIRDEVLDKARQSASRAGVSDVCEFTKDPPPHADLVVSIDAFEHFEDPAAILSLMASLLPDGGEALISFGPTWLHPVGGHLFSVFPWAHLLFSEKALIRWRSDFKDDGATRFHEVAGGLNQMTIKRFESLIEASPFTCEQLECVPIRKLAPLHNRLTREYTSSLVRCRLKK